jgi:pilus assembly protein CpaE
MNRPMTALVALDEYVDRGIVETMLTSSPRLDVTDFVDLTTGHSSVGDGDVLIVACASFTPEVAEFIGDASRASSRRPVLLVCTEGTNGYVGEAMEAGAEDIVTLPSDSNGELVRAASRDMVFSVEKAIARKRGAPVQASADLGRMICVLGLKGGGGKTLTSSNLAATLAARGHSVAIVDLDLQFGDVGLALGLTPERTLYDLVRSGGSLDAEKLADFLTVHPSGVRALMAPARPDQAGVVTADFLRDVYPLLRAMHEFVIVDTPPSFTPEVIGAVDASTQVCVVAMLDSLSLKNSKLGLETLELMEYRGDVRVLLNRADSNVGISREDVVSILGRAPDVLVPSDRNITRSVNQGEPIALLHRRSDAARAFSTLAQLYEVERASVNGNAVNGNAVNGNGTPRRRRLFGRRK